MKINLSAISSGPTVNALIVGNKFPKELGSPRIAIINSHPYSKEAREPLSQSWLSQISSDCEEVGLPFHDCFVGNVLNFYPEKKHLTRRRSKMVVDITHPDVRESMRTLGEDLKAYNPDFLILFGDEPLQLLKVNCDNIDEERGAPFVSSLGYPAIATFHPTRVFVQYSYRVLVLHDLKKAMRLAQSGWSPPKYKIEFLPSYSEAMHMLDTLERRKPFLSVDIETNSRLHITCIGIAYNRTSAMTIPFVGERGKAYFDQSQERELWKKLKRVLESCQLVGHNAVHFDHYVLLKNYGINARFEQDTMFAHWEQYAEFPKSLGFISSLYTDNPYWKGVLKEARSGKVPYWKEYEYCAKDCIVCMQCLFEIASEMNQPEKDHYRFNIQTSKAFQYMSLRGARLDRDKYSEKLHKLEMQAYGLAEQFSEESGKKMPDILKGSTEMTVAEKRLFNLRSHVKVKNWLYKDLNLPPQTKLVKNEFGEREQKETADYLSLLYLGRQYPEHPSILTAGKLRKLQKRISSLRAYETDEQGVLHWTFNLVATVTGRAAGYKPLDNKGVQPQNVDRNDRDLYLPPEGMHWLKFDLEGADSWTVAVILKSLGHDLMWDDLCAGLKPAARLAIAEVINNELLTAPAADLLVHKSCLKSDQGKTVYKINKAVSHGTNYGMKKMVMHQNIFKQSDGELFVKPEECEVRQKVLMDIYGISDMHMWAQSQMVSKGTLTNAAGTSRRFFGRRDNQMVKSMLSHLPQFHTGLTTNVVIWRMFYSAHNRMPDGDLMIPLLNQVHDEANGAIRHGMEDKSVEFLQSVVDVPLTLMGMEFKIPFEGGYGPDWGSQPNEIKL